MTSTDSSSGPAIRSFQMDGSAIGDLSSAVNLFRGDVNLTQNLITLPGREAEKGMDVEIACQYQSNVTKQAGLWNRDAPTGILGLGWDMPLTYIEATGNGSPVPANRQYTFYENGTPNQLYRQTHLPVLFTLDGELAETLECGQVAPDEILSGFRKLGLAIDGQTQVSGEGPWFLEDETLGQTYKLELDADSLKVYDGGEVYQLQNYEFWRIIYYPAYERWVVVTDTGTRRSFGGRTESTDQGYQTGEGNSIAWEVWWAGQSGLPAWQGASLVSDNQVQVARAWYQARVEDRFGNRISYTYNGWDRDQDGLIPQVEQRVGEEGLPYTKAIYLTRVTDVFGRWVDFTYGEKLWGEGETEPREYADPHQEEPSAEPGAFQDRYETRYLETIVVRDLGGEALFSYKMIYAPRPEIEGEASAVANLNDSEEGDTYKRYLTEIRMLDGGGVPRPGMQMDYYLHDEEGFSPGALKTITYPEGGVATYTYTRQELDICRRDYEVPRPEAVPSGASPRVFHGPDYTLVCYYNQSSLELSLQVFTWDGNWMCWQLEDDAILDTGGLDLETLSALPAEDFLVLFFDRTSPAEKAAYVFQKDTARPGQWLPATVDGVTTAPDTPTLVWSQSGAKVTFVGGDTFFAVSQMDSGSSSGSIDRVTFRWPTMDWTKETIESPNYAWITGANRYYATLDSEGNFTVFYLSDTLVWQENQPVCLDDLSAFDLEGIALVPGSALVAIANLTSYNSSRNTYRLWIAAWDANLETALADCGSFTDEFGTDAEPTTWVPTVVEDTLVAVNGNLARFNGSDWEINTNLNPGISPTDSSQRYAFGPDVALQIIAPQSGVGDITAMGLAYDPGDDSGDWDSSPTAIDESLKLDDRMWPTGGGADWLVIGPYLYFRGHSQNWAEVVAGDPVADINQILDGDYQLDSQSLINQAPAFLSYRADQDSSNVTVQSILLENGQAQTEPLTFADQKMVSPAEWGATGQGVSAEGPNLFVTYPASAIDFNSAQSVYLNRYAGDTVVGPVVHYTVATLVINDGFDEPIPTAYDFDSNTAGCDADGQVVKYFKCRVYGGTRDPDVPLNGWTETQYLNGQRILTGENFYNMLDGMLYREELCDREGETVQRTTKTYQVYQEVSSDPAGSEPPGIRLRGGWIAQMEEEVYNNGVTTTKLYGYVGEGQPGPFTGEPLSQETQSYNGLGILETFIQTSVYGVQCYEALWAINGVNDLIQESTVVVGQDGTVPVESMANPFAAWDSGLGDNVKAWANEAEFGLHECEDEAFPFADYRQGDLPDGWVLASRVTRRGCFGGEVETENSLGVPTATLYAKDGLFTVAQAANATREGFTWLGFQPYEDLSAWTVENVVFDGSLAHAGTQSALLAGHADAKLAVTVFPHRGGATYLLGCWYLTPEGFQSSDDSGWTLELSIDGEAQPAISQPFADTEGRWRYQTLPVSIPATESASPEISLRLEVTNRGSDDVFVNAIYLGPLVNGLTARFMNQATGNVLATMDAAGRISRTYYDTMWQPTMSVGAAGQVREITQSFLSRQGSTDGRFQAGSPNADLTLHPAGGGFLESFRDGGAWQQRWTASNLEGNWTEGQGALIHNAQEADTLTWCGDPIEETFAVYLELRAAQAPELSIAFGDLVLGFGDDGFYGSQGDNQWTPLVQPPHFQRQLLLVVGEGVVLLFSGGQLLFSESATAAGSDLVLSIGTPDVGLRKLVLARQIRLGISYKDGAARERQVQQLHGGDALVCDQVYDSLNRQIATTRNAPGSFGSGSDLAVLQYRPDFHDHRAFRDNLNGSWELSGDVADYYRGQTEDGVTRSDDQGYPYFGTRYEASPRENKVETGKPGKAYAINLTLTAEERQTLQYEWGSGTAQDDPDGNPFCRETLISPVKTRSTQLKDPFDQLIGTTYEDDQDQLVSSVSGLRSYTNDGGPVTKLTVQLPNATTDGPQDSSDGFQDVKEMDGLQRNLSQQSPSAGKTQFVCDGAGQLRFVQPPLDSGETWFIYYKYDALGRQVEEGTVDGSWDRDELTRLAQDPDWPVEEARVVTRNSYDGDGSLPHLIGQKHRAVTINSAPSEDADAGDITVTETFTYNAAGQLTNVETEIEGAASGAGAVGYRYNILGEIIQVDLPEGAPLQSIFYGRDDQGRVLSVGTEPGSGDLGLYTYDSDGAVVCETLGGGAWQQVIQYNSPGWITSQRFGDSSEAQSLDLDYEYAADGAIMSRRVDLKCDGAEATYEDAYGYDHQRRLSTATGSSQLEITSYDPNGNIWALTQDGREELFNCEAGSDRLEQVTIDGVQSQIAFNARGQQISGQGRCLGYDNCTAKTNWIGRGDNAIRLAYGGSQQRVFKQCLKGSGEDVLYINGAASAPHCPTQGRPLDRFGSRAHGHSGGGFRQVPLSPERRHGQYLGPGRRPGACRPLRLFALWPTGGGGPG